jgi:hypothetical protein
MRFSSLFIVLLTGLTRGKITYFPRMIRMVIYLTTALVSAAPIRRAGACFVVGNVALPAEVSTVVTSIESKFCLKFMCAYMLFKCGVSNKKMMSPVFQQLLLILAVFLMYNLVPSSTPALISRTQAPVHSRFLCRARWLLQLLNHYLTINWIGPRLPRQQIHQRQT